MPVITDPNKIEQRSFEIIKERLRKKGDSPQRAHSEAGSGQSPFFEVIARVVHTTADFNYANDLRFHKEAVEAGVNAIKKGKKIIVDSSMVYAGINKTSVSKFKSKVFCFINDKSIIRQSQQRKITRAILAMRKASKLMRDGIVSIGNAPTALFELCDLIKQGKAKPSLIIGLPVGFVGAKESKKELRSLGVPYITNISRKGGSNIAACVVNALLKLAEKR